MTSVSDTGPLNYLIQIGAASALEALFGTVLVPRAVWRELGHPSSPAIVQAWVTAMPPWCEVVDLEPSMLAGGRGAGEREAIQLAMQVSAAVMLADDQAARAAAKRLTSAEVIGTIGILVQASMTRAPDRLKRFNDWIERLRATNFYFSLSLDAAIEDARAQIAADVDA